MWKLMFKLELLLFFQWFPTKLQQSIDFVLFKLFCFYFQVLAFKIIELEYPRVAPSTLDFIPEISLSSKLKIILFCNLTASKISTMFTFLSFTYLFKSFWIVFICCTNCFTAALKLFYSIWVPESIFSSSNLSIQAFTHRVTIFLGSIRS